MVIALISIFDAMLLVSNFGVFPLQTVDDFRTKLNTELRKKHEGVAQNIMPEGYLEAPLAYDAIWAVALALNRTMARLAANGTSLEDYNYENQAIADIIKNEIGDVQFMGMSVRYSNMINFSRVQWITK